MKLGDLIRMAFIIDGSVDGGVGNLDQYPGIQKSCIGKRRKIDYRIDAGEWNGDINVDRTLVNTGSANCICGVEVPPVDSG